MTLNCKKQIKNCLSRECGNPFLNWHRSKSMMVPRLRRDDKLFAILCYIITFLTVIMSLPALAQQQLNLYIWGGIIPQEAITQFENETGIIVNLSTYDSNETLYAKLKANANNKYDVILPSSYLVSRLVKHNKLLTLNPALLPNLKNIDPFFIHQAYDPNQQFSVPLIWGATGIVLQKNMINPIPDSWNELWSQKFKKQILLLDDSREIFSMALLHLGYRANDADKNHIRLAFESLRALIPNIKLFATEGIQSLIIDKEVSLAVAWNGDALKAHEENQEVDFVYPKEGFVIWVDCLSILKNAPHQESAYKFINFMLRPDIGKLIAVTQGHAITNQASKELLPLNIRNNTMIYPDRTTMQRGQIQADLDESALQLYNHYWEKLKLLF